MMMQIKRVVLLVIDRGNTLRRLCVCHLLQLCIYMPAIDRSLSSLIAGTTYGGGCVHAERYHGKVPERARTVRPGNTVVL